MVFKQRQRKQNCHCQNFRPNQPLKGQKEDQMDGLKV